jgi:hypothetical protein
MQPQPDSSAAHPVQGAFVLLPVGTPYHGTPKYDSVGKVQEVLAAILAQSKETGKGRGPFIPLPKGRGLLAPERSKLIVPNVEAGTKTVLSDSAFGGPG